MFIRLTLIVRLVKIIYVGAWKKVNKTSQIWKRTRQGLTLSLGKKGGRKMKWLKKRDAYSVYLYTCFWSEFIFTFIFTVSLLYHVKVVGLDPLQLVLVGTVLELSVFLFEIPTGMVSDLKSRKLSIVIGYFLIGAGFLLEGLFPYFVPVLIAQVVWGIGYTFTSGSRQAWIADEIGEERASKAFVNGAKVSSIGKVIAIPLSIGTAFIEINLPIAIGGCSMIALAVWLMFRIKEENFQPLEVRASIWSTMTQNMGKIVSHSKSSFLLRILFLIALFIGLYSEGFDRLWLTHLLDVSRLGALNDESLILLTGGLQLVVVIGSAIVLQVISKSRIYESLRHIYVALFLSSLLIIMALLGFAFSSTITVTIICYIVIQLTRKVMYPLEDVWLNKMIKDSHTRATFFSVKGQVDAIGQIGGGPIIGWISTAFTVKVGLVASALLLSPVLIFYRMVLKRKREK